MDRILDEQLHETRTRMGLQDGSRCIKRRACRCLFARLVERRGVREHEIGGRKCVPLLDRCRSRRDERLDGLRDLAPSMQRASEARERGGTTWIPLVEELQGAVELVD